MRKLLLAGVSLLSLIGAAKAGPTYEAVANGQYVLGAMPTQNTLYLQSKKPDATLVAVNVEYERIYSRNTNPAPFYRDPTCVGIPFLSAEDVPVSGYVYGLGNGHFLISYPLPRYFYNVGQLYYKDPIYGTCTKVLNSKMWLGEEATFQVYAPEPITMVPAP